MSHLANPWPEWPSLALSDQDLLVQFSHLPGLQAFLTLRQAHALEHATVWVLNEMQQERTSFMPGQSDLTHQHFSLQVERQSIDDGSLGGLATERGFYLYGTVASGQLHQAVQTALHRLRQGDWRLALHPRCGTNTLVAIALAAGLTLGAVMFSPRDPLSQFLGVGAATLAATQLAPDVGLWVQQHLTTAIPFNIRVDRIFPTVDAWGRSAHFIQVKWCDRV